MSAKRISKNLLYVVNIVVIFFFILLIAKGMRDFHFDESPEFPFSMRGRDYEVTINKGDPAVACLGKGREDQVQMVAPNYFYMTQGRYVIFGVFREGSFRVNQQLSGCWNIITYDDSVRIRFVNFSGGEIFFNSRDANLENRYEERYLEMRQLLSGSVCALTILVAVSTSTPLVFDKKDD